MGTEGARLLEEQAGRLVEFLDARLRARERLRALRFRAPFAVLREGQEQAEGDLRAAFAAGRTAVLLEAPTGFGKTGVLLAFGLGALREGRFERLVYLTGKSTGQLQVVSTLAAMTEAGQEGKVEAATQAKRGDGGEAGTDERGGPAGGVPAGTGTGAGTGAGAGWTR